MKAILKNLENQITNETVIKSWKIMYCPYCGGTYSANVGDYFYINNPNYKFKCCGHTMDLVIQKIKYIVA